MRQFPYEIKYSVGVSGGRPHRTDALLSVDFALSVDSCIDAPGVVFEAPNGAMSDGVTVLPLSVDGDRGQR